MIIKSFDKVSCRNLHAEAMKALEEVAKRHGLEVKYSGGNFSSKNFLTKFEFSTIGEDGQVNSQEVEAFKKAAFWYGLDPADFGKEFVAMGKCYVICGLKPKSRKFPVLAKELGGQGRTIKFSAETVKFGLNRKEI